jgi:endonuclease/exonuclease/phosphatase family metal-dependent hydrolase
MGQEETIELPKTGVARRVHGVWRSAALFVLAAGLVIGTGAAPGPAPAAPSAPASAPATHPAAFTLATFNVNYGIAQDAANDQQRRAQLEAVVEAIRKCDADVVALQEGNEQIYAQLHKSFDKTYPSITVYKEGAAAGFVWLSKTPLQNLKVLPPLAGEEAWFRTPLAIVRFQNRAILLANVHLQPTVVRDGGILATLKAIKDNDDIRATEIRYIWTKIEQEQKAAKTDLPVVLLGDFNSPAILSTGSFLSEKGLIDSFASANPDPETHPTWQSAPNPGALSFRVDFIWHSPRLTTLSSRVVAADVSDHKPVVSQLYFTPASATATAPTPPGK